MKVVNWLINNLENLYYIVGILLSSTIIISLLQYKASKDKTKKDETKDINNVTSELLIEYYQNIVPAVSRLKKNLKGNFYLINRKEIFSFSPEINKSAQQYFKNVDPKLTPYFEELLAYMQSFSVKYELSDCNVVTIEKTVGKSFSDIFEIIVPCLLENGYDNYTELIDTFNTYNLNIQKRLNESQLNETQKKIEENNLKKKRNNIRKN